MDILSMESEFTPVIIIPIGNNLMSGDIGKTKKDWVMKKSLTALAFATACAVPSFAGPGLADGAAKFVGNITTNGQVRSDFGTYWNQITAENECKWASIEGSRGNYNFTGCKNAYNWAKNNGGHFKFHALVWGSQYPSWLGNLSEADTKTAITNWFDAVQKQFPDLEMIDVVNEAIRTGNNSYHSGYTNTKIIQALGGDNNGDYTFVTTAFKMARERWPEAILIYNDYNTVQWQKNEGIQLIQTIKKNGAPVDGYGLQAHDMMTQGGGAGGTGGSGGCLNINTLKGVIEEIWTKTETPMFISEYDIGTDDDNTQKQCYSEQISYFMENEHVAGITLWGYIYGSTWTTNGNSGIIKNGNDRPAMTWLKEYLSKNKGVNTTGLAGGEVRDPEPQTPYGGTAASIPGKIEAENYDVPGYGSGNNSYSVASSGNGNSDYRKDTSPNLYKGGTGVVIGYNNTDNWYEYTVDVKETGSYTMYAAVASAGGGAFTLSIDGKAITESIAVPAAKSGTDTYDEYEKVSADVNLTAGQHILRLTVDKQYFDIDYITFVAKGEKDPEPIDGDDAIGQTIQLGAEVKADYDVFDMQGQFMGRLSAYNFGEAISTVQNGNIKFAKGVYFVRNRTNGKMQNFRIVK